MSQEVPQRPEDFRYDLPAELIAQQPAPRRSDARLLRIGRGRGVQGEVRFCALPSLLAAGDLLVLNDSRVLPARLRLRRMATGGRLELLLVRPVGPGEWLALVRPFRRLRPGLQLQLANEEAVRAGAPGLEITSLLGQGYVTVGSQPGDLSKVAERWGEVPLPSYIRRGPGNCSETARIRQDQERYQTVYARHSGSVAAPTAGLHFEADLLRDLRRMRVGIAAVTLHVGPGTFRPPTEAQVRSRRLHGEMFHCPASVSAAIRKARQAGGRIIAVGTTSLRVLETVRRLELDSRPQAKLSWSDEPGQAPALFTGSVQRHGPDWDVRGMTRLFLRPPDEISACDGLLTNFHLPGSSLIMLVAAFAGDRVWRDAYAFAVANRFRFYSYGDAMLII
jgi:S-adenosylmethionine:tRNA ribosyltransferase-isomerase